MVGGGDFPVNGMLNGLVVRKRIVINRIWDAYPMNQVYVRLGLLDLLLKLGDLVIEEIELEFFRHLV